MRRTMDDLEFETVVMAAAEGMRRGTWDWGEEGEDQLEEFLNNECSRAIIAVLDAGFAIVPAAEVPTEAQRAAVGRMSQAVDLSRLYREYLASDPESFNADVSNSLRESFYEVLSSITTHDIEAARAVAEGGTNG